MIIDTAPIYFPNKFTIDSSLMDGMILNAYNLIKQFVLIKSLIIL